VAGVENAADHHPDLAASNLETQSRVQKQPAGPAWADERLRQETAARRKAEDRLQRNTLELQLLHHVVHRLGSSLDLEHVITTILDEARHLLDATGCTLWRPEFDRGRLICWRGSGAHREQLCGFVLPLGQGVVGWAVEQGQDALLSDTRTDPRHCKEIDQQTGVEIRSIACARLEIKGRLIGVLEVVSDKPGSFDENDLSLLKTFACSAVVALEHARLYAETNELRAFNENIVQNMREGVVIEDEAGQITFANPAAVEMLDCSVGDLRGREWQSLIAPEFLDWIGPESSKGHYETVLRTASERRLQVIVSSRPMYDGGQLVGRLVTFSDISDRKQREDVLRRRNQELSLLNSVITASVEGQSVEGILAAVCREVALAFHASHAVAALFDEGQDQATIVAEYPAHARAAASAPFPLPAELCLEELARRKQAVVLERKSAGEPLPEPLARCGAASLLLAPLLVEGKLAGCLAFSRGAPYTFSSAQAELAQHVAEQVSGSLTRARLNERQHRLSTAVEQAAEAVLITDATGSILYANPSFEQASGYSRAEVIDQSLATLDRELWDRLAGGKTRQGRHLHRRKDGSQFLADGTAAPVRNGAGEIVSYVLTLRDVTHIVALEEQYYHAQKMEAVGRIVGGIAHDYKNVLTIIEMASGILALQTHPKDPLQEHVATIQGASRRARDLTQQLLRFSRRESTRPEILDLNRLIEDMGWLLECLVDEDIKLHTKLSSDPATVRMHLSQMEQVIMNLSINARDAMPKGGTLTIETANVVIDERQHRGGGSQAASYVLLIIADSGVGMDAEVRAHLFEPYFTTKERGKGTGLGLPAVLDIVQQTGGHIKVDSQPGQGTTFRIYLPRATGGAPGESPGEGSGDDENEMRPADLCPLVVGIEED
jgi:PAS domain S-box-containing protein